MATLNQRIREHLTSDRRPTLAKFVKKEEMICLDYVEQFDTVNVAKKHLTRRYVTLSKNLGKRKPDINNVSWEKLFEKAKTRESLRIASFRGIRASVPGAITELEKSIRGECEYSAAEESKKEEDEEEDEEDEEEEGRSDHDGILDVKDNVIDSNTLKSWRRYTADSTIIANRKGLSVVNDLHRILCLSHIMLLKPNQHDQGLANMLSENHRSRLHHKLCERYLDSNVALSDDCFLALKKLVEDVVAEKLTRADAKRRLMAINLDQSDCPIIDIVYNGISDLPRFSTDTKIGELQLITSFLDPVLRPLLHEPDEMRLLRWTNRICAEIDECATKRPDAAMTLCERFHGASALGFCEAKPEESTADVTLRFLDLLRLALFAKGAIDKEEIRAIMVVQAIGPSVTFYMMEIMASGLYPLVELATVTVPQTLVELLNFLMSLQTLKRIYVAYRKHCTKLDEASRQKVKRWKKSSLTNDQLDDIINATHGKQNVPWIRL